MQDRLRQLRGGGGRSQPRPAELMDESFESDDPGADVDDVVVAMPASRRTPTSNSSSAAARRTPVRRPANNDSDDDDDNNGGGGGGAGGGGGDIGNMNDFKSTTKSKAGSSVAGAGSASKSEAGGGGESSSGISPDQIRMARFFETVGEIKKHIDIIRTNAEAIEGQAETVLGEINSSATQAAREELNKLLSEGQRSARLVKNTLNKLEQDNRILKQGDPSNAYIRIRENHASSLTREFMEAMRQLQGVQRRFNEEMTENVTRRIKIVRPDATEEEIETMMDEPDSIFADQILNASYMEARTAWSEIQEKHRDILKLQQSMQELHQIFVDMSILVETQGELINNIRDNVASACAYVEKGVDNLNQARKYQTKARKKQCCLLVIVLIIAAIIMAPLLSSAL